MVMSTIVCTALLFKRSVRKDGFEPKNKVLTYDIVITLFPGDPFDPALPLGPLKKKQENFYRRVFAVVVHPYLNLQKEFMARKCSNKGQDQALA